MVGVFTCQENGSVCRRKMRMSGLCKVGMSAFLRARGPDGRGADRVEHEGAGAFEGVHQITQGHLRQIDAARRLRPDTQQDI
jgi:hypothetical protein